MKVRGWLVAIACVLPFLATWTYGLFDLDEGFYAAVVADMIRRGDWITPTLNGSPWFEKPILAYWLAIPSIQVFGEWVGPRLPSALCTLATALVLSRFVRRHGGADGPFLSLFVPLVYCGSLLVVAIGRLMMTDAPLVLCLTLAGTTFFDSLHGDRRLRLASAVFVGLGVLAKGPVAAVLFLGLVAMLYARLPERRPEFRGYWALGVGLCLGVLATWYVPCYMANGQTFVQKFLIEQNVGRFTGGDKAHAVPWWSHPVYYPLIVVLAALPYWPRVAGQLFRRGERAHSGLWEWALGTVLVPLVFFTLSGTKLPHYILPAMPGVAVLVGLAFAQFEPRRQEAWLRFGLGWCAFVSVMAWGVFTWDWTNRMADVQRLAIRARREPGPLVVYRIGREGPMGTGSLELQDTSHPSINFYYRRPVVEAETPEALPYEKGGFLVLTRDGRWERDAANLPAGWTSELVREEGGRGGYRLWRVTASVR
ncbi:MAG: glycosyltransferase family 39 protein [Fimbriimonadaceae bacterium]|nr:glycosyltransferase family 39 protein [Fimbriimonadaceae bacterium]QYK55774.1 MAG: glycosyltransferase family 39 protein [Fimbriimonadaceae bacterium]